MVDSSPQVHLIPRGLESTGLRGGSASDLKSDGSASDFYKSPPRIKLRRSPPRTPLRIPPRTPPRTPPVLSPRGVHQIKKSTAGCAGILVSHLGQKSTTKFARVLTGDPNCLPRTASDFRPLKLGQALISSPRISKFHMHGRNRLSINHSPVSSHKSRDIISDLTLRCKAIRGRILGVGAAWLGLGGARAHLLGRNKGPCDAWLFQILT